MSSKQPTRHEVNALITRILAWPDLAKFEVFDALREDLAGAMSEENRENRKVRERKEALVVMKKVAEELGLPANKAPTAKQFNAVASELVEQAAKDGSQTVAEGWNSARVVRLWERWGMAASAYKGHRRINTPASRKRRGRLRGKTKQGDDRERHFKTIKTWLDSKPVRLTIRACEEFIEEYNSTLQPGTQPLALADTVNRNIPLKWEKIIAVARGDLTMEAALEVELAENLPSQRKEALVGLATIARFLDRSLAATTKLCKEDEHFPIPVAHIRGHPAWLYEDVKLYKRGLAAPERVEDEKQALFVDAEQLCERIGLSMESLRKYIRHKRWDKIPQPEGAIVIRYPYWRREKVEAWLKTRVTTAKASS